MSNSLRYCKSGLAAVFVGFWSLSPAAALPATISTLLSDPNTCWEVQPYYDGTGWGPSHERPMSGSEVKDKLGVANPNISYKPDLSVPGETSIVARVSSGSVSFHRYHRIPCPPPKSSYTGLNGGFSLNETVGILTWIESLNGVTTNQNSARRDPFGAGINIGYGFRPWNNNLVVNPFLSFDYQGWSVNYVFPNGSFIGTKSNYEGTAGVKIGPTFPAGVWLYAIGGVSFLNETLTVNFIPVSSSTTKTVPGATLGLGGAIQPSWLQVFGVPTSLSLEWQHTWWQTANFNNPASSPAFSYAYKREDDKIKLGINFYLSR